MSLDYDLRLCTNLNVQQIQDLVLKLARDVQTSETPGILVGPGVTISALPESEIGKAITAENYGLKPTVEINFRLNKLDQSEEGQKTAVKLSLALLATTRSDGVLLLNHDTPVLMCKAGKIMLDPGPGFWPGLPLLVGEPHSIGRLSLRK